MSKTVVPRVLVVGGTFLDWLSYGPIALTGSPRLRKALLTQIRKSQVRSDDRPSNASRPVNTASQVSCTSSSALP
jgi:hypothetical protein